MNRALTRVMSAHIQEQSLKKSYFQVAIYNLPQLGKIRDLRSIGLGRLGAIYGTVTRTTDAKPELIKGTFSCLECNSEVRNVEQ